MNYKIPTQYKIYHCACSKKLRYSSQKQLNFVLAMHKTSNKHRKFVGWPLNEKLDPLLDYQLPSCDLLDNKEFEKQLKELLH